MSKNPLKTIGLEPPKDFPQSPYEKTHKRVASRIDSNNNSWKQYAGAWNAVAYRFIAFKEYDQDYIASFKRSKKSSTSEERYLQEKALFGFFMNGYSTIESFCYALYSIASIVDILNFPLTSGKLKRVSPEEVAKDFENTFPKEKITKVLNDMINDPMYRDLKKIRNVLIHRSAPPRTVHLSSGSVSRPDDWKLNNYINVQNIQLDENTTISRRTWLAKILEDLMYATDIFTAKYL